MTRGVKAFWLFASPFIGLVSALLLFAVLNFSLASVDPSTVSDGVSVATRIINMVLGLIGVGSMLLLFVGWPYAIYLLSTDDKPNKK